MPKTNKPVQSNSQASTLTLEERHAYARAGVLANSSERMSSMMLQMGQAKMARLRAQVQNEAGKVPADFAASLEKSFQNQETALAAFGAHISSPTAGKTLPHLSPADIALLVSVSSNDVPGATQALAAGACRDATNADNRTALGMAAIQGNEDLFEMLWQAGCRKLWEKDDVVRPALTIAAEHDNHVAVALLLRAGVDPNTKSASGDSALKWSKGRKTKALLRKAGAV